MNTKSNQRTILHKTTLDLDRSLNTVFYFQTKRTAYTKIIKKKINAY